MRIVKIFFLLPFTPKRMWQDLDRNEVSSKRLCLFYFATSILISLIFQITRLVLLGQPFPGASSIITSYLFIFELTFVLFITDFVLSILIMQFSPIFLGLKDYNASLKLVVLSKFVVIVFGILRVLLEMNFLSSVGVFFQNVLLYYGYQEVLKIPKEKSLAFAIMVFILYSVTLTLISIGSIYILYNTLKIGS